MLKCIKTLLVLFFSLVVIYNHTHAQNPKADTLKIKGAMMKYSAIIIAILKIKITMPALQKFYNI